MASNLEKYLEGLKFRVYGIVQDASSFNNDNGEMQRMVRISTSGKMFSLFVNTDEELNKYGSLVGSFVLCSGRVTRMKNSASVSCRLESVISKGQPGWSDPSATDLVVGCVVEGVVALERKSSGVREGRPYSTLMFKAMGDVFEVKNVPTGIYAGLPEDRSSMIAVRFLVDYGLGWDGGTSARFSEMRLSITEFRILPPDMAEGKPSREKAA